MSAEMNAVSRIDESSSIDIESNNEKSHVNETAEVSEPLQEKPLDKKIVNGFRKAFGAVIQGMEYVGEMVADVLGLDDSKFQDVIDGMDERDWEIAQQVERERQAEDQAIIELKSYLADLLLEYGVSAPISETGDVGYIENDEVRALYGEQIRAVKERILREQDESAMREHQQREIYPMVRDDVQENQMNKNCEEIPSSPSQELEVGVQSIELCETNQLTSKTVSTSSIGDAIKT